MAKKSRPGYRDAPATIPTLSSEDVELLMLTLIRKKDAFLAVREHIKSEDLSTYSPHFHVLWLTLQAYYEEHEELPSYQTLTRALKAHRRHFPDSIDVQELRDLFDFCRRAWKIKPDSVSLKWAIKTTRKFLEERLTERIHASLGSDQERPSSLPDALRECQIKSEVLSSLQGEETDKPYPDSWESTPIGIKSTGLDFLDEFLGGGHAKGECNTILGPTGSCKTTLMLQLASCGVYDAYNSVQLHRTKKTGLIYVVSYEAPVDPELRYRMLCCHAQVDREVFEKNLPYSTSNDPKPYERRLFAAELAQPGAFEGETVRIRNAIAMLNRHLRFIDCSGADAKHPNRGNGFVSEIAGLIRNDLRTRKNTKVALVVVDWAGVMVHKYLSAAGKDAQQARYYLSRLPGDLVSQIALPFKCPVWVSHQLAGAVNKKSPGAMMHHTDSADCKNFADFCSFAFVVGTQDQDNHSVIRCTKARRQPKHSSLIIKLEGSLGTVHGVNGKYVLEEGSRRIMHISEARRAGQARKEKADKKAAKQGMPVAVNPTPIAAIES